MLSTDGVALNLNPQIYSFGVNYSSVLCSSDLKFESPYEKNIKF